MQTANSKQQTALRIRSKINQIDPQLDAHWQKDLQTLIQQLPEQQVSIIRDHLRKKRKIDWNDGKQCFTYKIPTNCIETPDFIEDDSMRGLAQKVHTGLRLIKTYQSAEQIAQGIEAIISEIEKFDVQDNLQSQRYKQLIKQDFAYATAKVIHELSDIQVAENTRYINKNVFKSYLTEVYLKQYLKGYFFKTLRQRDILEDMRFQHLDFLLPEKKARQLELVMTSEYLFAVAPSYNIQLSPYSLLRFLNEERFAHAGTVYFNVAYIKLEHLHDPETINFFKWQINRIVTIQKSIRPEIIDTVDFMEQNVQQHLDPCLEKPLDLGSLQIDDAINQRLFEFEQALTLYILTPLQHVLVQVANHPDEYEYLYISIQSLFGDILNIIQDFQNQPITLFNKNVERFIARVNAYALLLVKRYHQLFVAQDEQTWQAVKNHSDEAIDQLKQLIAEANKDYRSLHKQRKEIEREQNDYNPSFFGKLFGKKRDFNAELAHIDRQVQKISEQHFIEIIRHTKKYQQDSVYIEFETETKIDEQYRHYAYITGEYGIGRIPVLMILPEDRRDFQLAELNKQLENDLYYILKKIHSRINEQQRINMSGR